jgi:hypothetical protein
VHGSPQDTMSAGFLRPAPMPVQPDLDSIPGTIRSAW